MKKDFLTFLSISMFAFFLSSCSKKKLGNTLAENTLTPPPFANGQKVKVTTIPGVYTDWGEGNDWVYTCECPFEKTCVYVVTPVKTTLISPSQTLIEPEVGYTSIEYFVNAQNSDDENTFEQNSQQVY